MGSLRLRGPTLERLELQHSAWEPCVRTPHPPALGEAGGRVPPCVTETVPSMSHWAPPAWALSLDAVGGAGCLSKIHVISLSNPPPSHPRFLRRPPPAGREKQGVPGIGVLSAALFLRVRHPADLSSAQTPLSPQGELLLCVPQSPYRCAALHHPPPNCSPPRPRAGAPRAAVPLVSLPQDRRESRVFAVSPASRTTPATWVPDVSVSLALVHCHHPGMRDVEALRSSTWEPERRATTSKHVGESQTNVGCESHTAQTVTWSRVGGQLVSPQQLNSNLTATNWSCLTDCLRSSALGYTVLPGTQ
ncbi:uncharacterized protein LOC132354342 [Balaenoptera ricei]|uniref:uncharacterized protein LOC132354342 n=1 Tax=Balaenoptera ricei TaxID=2746895 RepID=UPI0028BD76C7|nr:uncharacterized protein LOC132354342 [Balaenoptera ricei]